MGLLLTPVNDRSQIWRGVNEIENEDVTGSIIVLIPVRLHDTYSPEHVNEVYRQVAESEHADNNNKHLSDVASGEHDCHGVGC